MSELDSFSATSSRVDLADTENLSVSAGASDTDIDRAYLEETIRKSRYRNTHALGTEVGASWDGREAHSLHSLVPRLGGFPAKLARWAIDTYSEPGQVLLDPFCGKGTAPLEALLAGRRAIGSDVAPDAYVVTCAKLSGVTHDEAASLLARLRLVQPTTLDEIPQDVRLFFEDNALRQIIATRDALFSELNLRPGEIPSLSGRRLSRRSRAAVYLLACLLGCLHGPVDWGRAKPQDGRPSNPNSLYLSVHCNHAYAASPTYVRRYCQEHGLKPPVRDVAACLMKKSLLVQVDGLPANAGRALCRRAETLRLRTRADLVVTSPPYFKAQTYAWDNWLRLWLLGYPDYRTVARTLLQTASIPRYYDGIRLSLQRVMAMLSKPSCRVVVVVGDVRTRVKGRLPFLLENDRWRRYVTSHSGKGQMINTSEIIGDIAAELGFRVALIVNDYIPRADRVLASFLTSNHGTDLDRAVVLERIG
jgi:hypothetical protein